MYQVRITQTKSRVYSPNPVSKLLGGFYTRSLCPLRLINTNLVKDRGELVTVFSIINLFRICTQDVNTGFFEAKSDILRKLT